MLLSVSPAIQSCRYHGYGFDFSDQLQHSLSLCRNRNLLHIAVFVMHHQCKSSILFPVFTICRYDNFLTTADRSYGFHNLSVPVNPGFCRLPLFHPLMQTDAAQSLPHNHNPGALSRCRLPAGYFPAHKAAGRNSQICPCKTFRPL